MGLELRLLSGCDPGQHTSGPAATFEEARAAFELAWARLLPTRTDADFEAWRNQRDWTERKNAMWASGEKLPSQIPSSKMRCPCGVEFDSHVLADDLVHVPHSHAIFRTKISSLRLSRSLVAKRRF
ncbi:hypothetical protein SAMN05216337_105129 [Bradyrhizobium brasilense]|uniref:Uncharacterized protein n=1 Tax=Bradyrhizobium brasilense TaxID=1419277 RepID=A0A1G7K4P6_9BRAD|nr:hypothetical protein [Bradyrhizobium brasilense]SDF31961.1 hypothetical protein SAMN05216337_105129 [Bradyrhizobium brasilense]